MSNKENDQTTIEQLARDQGVGPVTDLAEFATLSDLTDEEFDQFLNDATEARGYDSGS